MIPISRPVIDAKSRELVLACLNEEQISSKGPFVAQFEQEFARWLKCPDAATVFNGTVALHLPLVCLGIGPGDEVIVPNFTFAATINAVLYTGATPVLVDSYPDSLCLDLEKTLKAITPKTRAIIPVHLYGQVVDIPKLSQALVPINAKREKPIEIIEDCAEAHGARYPNGQMVGSEGLAGCFSFFANKIITTGEGGMISMSDPAKLAKLRTLRDHGMDRSQAYWHNEIGFNYRMTNLQAALGLGQLSEVNHFIRARSDVEKNYRTKLRDTPLTWLTSPKGATPVTWLATALTATATQRDKLIIFLKENGIDARPGFTPLDQMPPYKKFTHNDLRVSHEVAGRVISLPTYVGLTESDSNHICATISKFFKESK